MEERKRALVLGRVVAGRLTIPEAALLLGLSERSVWRLKSRFVAAELDPAALAHGNAGRLAAHRLDPALAERVVAFARHRWFGGDGPYASLHGAIDDATGEVLAAVFREEEDAAGYFTLLGQILAARGGPLAAYSDRHGVF